MSAGYVKGVPRLGVPAQLQSDASMGITNPGYRPDDKGATAFPSAILVGSSFNPSVARRYGLSYTTFDYKDLKVSGGETVTATFTVTNSGKVAGADVPQVYLTGAPDGRRMRLLGFERLELKPGESRFVTVTADPRLLARFEGRNGIGQWRIAGGAYRLALGKSAGEPVLTAETTLTARAFGK